ncbi:hypothetical protein Golax_004148 [Gossypium laxum]|uniref:RNase H type-1 domain-containing protein n=1 Tax=Gossypium laxum TaxID=34288 RepID=A0A7J9AHL6_9ROSI|nr:hypothetical protein [Gossypium laxum]
MSWGETMNGFVRLEDGSATAGGVVRNINGEWITSLNRFLGSCSVFEVELLKAVTTIKESLTGGSNSAMIKRILKLLYQLRHWNFCHIPKEDNQEADKLAKLAHLEN